MNIYKIGTAELYHIEYNNITYEVQIRTSKEGNKSISVDSELREQISDFTWESIYSSIFLGGSIEDAFKDLL